MARGSTDVPKGTEHRFWWRDYVCFFAFTGLLTYTYTILFFGIDFNLMPSVQKRP
eukprot:CAMPEP_0117555482 /NCGR_PEP_ID=MMETSP0784-20121206/51297_1 /TAXON_ID=39447 /ORGANISM="" /LENGTH=54 /DNA_ID=CAMNT_0005352689 /DNA_START=53 /DNA_END=217 /DNA_ORIENTATION=-